VARRSLTGALLVGGASTRFGSPKAQAQVAGRTLAELAWHTLGELCDERVAVGKRADRLALPFPLVDDGSDVRAPIVGVVAALRLARRDVCVVLPVDCPLVTADVLADFVDACEPDVDAAVPPTGPLPGVYRRSALPVLEGALASGKLALRAALEAARTIVVPCDTSLLANVNTRDDLRRLL
jgi:molybdopterin-guanine dinucleotide biosynthesis protein A